MYVNKIDELIDAQLDNFHTNYVRSNKLFEKIGQAPNFVKYQLKINEMLEQYIKSVDIKTIRQLVNNEDNVIRIIEIIKRYIAYYIFLFIGYVYAGSKENYINNIIEYTKNQSSYSLKITNFFNSENNANIIKFYDLIKNVLFVMDIPDIKNSVLVTPKGKIKYQDSINFLNELGEEFVQKNLKVSPKANTNEIFSKAHNLIKTIVFKELYLKQEKIDVFKILEEIEKEQGEYKYIDIVVPKTEYIDYNQIENLLTLKQIKQGMAIDIYEFLTEYQEIKEVEDIMPLEHKIQALLESRLVVPIVDDFLRYHKDTEKYEREKETFEEKKKKKEDTKIRYIVSKIDSVSDLYSESTRKNVELKKTIEKLFYAPLFDRRAVLINDIEEVKIINKLLNLGRKVIESNEYYLDLLNYRLYPYTNFKEFKDYGISVPVPSNISSPLDVIRYVSIEYRDQLRNQPLEWRIGSKDQLLNLVGLLIKGSSTPIECLKANHVLDIRTIKTKSATSDKTVESSNGYDLSLKYLSHILFKDKKQYPSVYWKFDLTKDKITLDKYEQLSKVNNQEQLKLILAKFYDDLVEQTYNYISDILAKRAYISFFDGYKLLQKYQKRYLNIPVQSDHYKNFIKTLFYEKHIPAEKRYDINEDKFPGLEEAVVKLPSFETAEKIIQDKSLISVEEDESYYVTALCQHNITWFQINELRRQNPNRFQALLFEFVQQYVMENRDQDYICKSCNNLLNIKKFIVDGAYDDDQGKYVLFSMPMEIPLEDMPEYEKYNRAIKTIEDKLLEKIASILNLTYYVGSTTNIKWRRRAITKTVLDLVLIHNKTIKKTYIKRNEEAIKLYNIQKDFSNFFVFDLDNSIFVYSSKDKDYYKQIKFNNVLAYIVFSLILEINENQIYSFTEDKVCNWYWFDKFGFNLFANMKIVKNKKLDLDYIQDYKILCYILYFISCMFSKHRIWNYDYEEDAGKKQTFHPTVQKTIIHTTVNLINSILEMSERKKKNYIYDIVATKFFLKLKTVFNNEKLIQRLTEKLETSSKFQVLTKKKLESKIASITLPGVYKPEDYPFLQIDKAILCRPMRFKLEKIREGLPALLEISTISNCPMGTFHQWKTENGVVACGICRVELANTPDIDKNKLISKYKSNNLDKLAQMYCPDGDSHEYENRVCQKCKKIEYDMYTPYELEQLEEALLQEKDKKIQNKLDNDLLVEEIKKTREQKFESIISKLKSKYIPGDNAFERFLRNVESIIGKDTSYNNIYLRENAYIIDHDHLGNEINPPIIATDKDVKFVFKENHPYFHTNVIYYTNKKLDIDIFYDANTHILLGYKELNKDYVKTDKKFSLYLKINYSIQQRLNDICFPSRYINVKDDITELKKYFKDSKVINKKIISDLSREKIRRLKKMITDIQRVIYQIKYTAPQEEKEPESKFSKFRQGPPSKLVEISLTNIIKKYQKGLNNMLLTKDNKKIFRYWRIMVNRLFYLPPNDKEIPEIANYLSSSEINRLDQNGNLLLFYIIIELNRLIDYNQNKFIKLNITHLILDIINYTYDLYNVEHKIAIHDIKRFKLMLEGSKFIIDIEKKGLISDEGGYGLYDEDIRPEDLDDEERLEQLETDKEMFDAIDMDNEVKFDYEQDNNDFYAD